MDATGARTIVPLMAFATGIALWGHLSETPAQQKLDHNIGDAQILLGGTAATVLLTLISMGGPVGGHLAKGLSVVTLLSVVGLYGTSAVKGLDSLTGQSLPAAEGSTAAAPGSRSEKMRAFPRWSSTAPS